MVDDVAAFSGDHPAHRLTVAPTQPRLGALVVRVFGELDAFTAPRLGRVLALGIEGVAREAARAPAPRDGHRPAASTGHQSATRPVVVCDLDGLEFVGGRGLWVLEASAAAATASAVRFVVVAGPQARAVRRAITLTNLDRVVPVRRSLLAADLGP